MKPDRKRENSVCVLRDEKKTKNVVRVNFVRLCV